MSIDILKLYHTSSRELKNPDVDYGRKNADFGGGFYLSDCFDFAVRWSGNGTNCVNHFTLDLSGLTVKRFSHDTEWYEYIAGNRAGKKDKYAGTDVIIGPVANDTLYETYGIIFSGFLAGDTAVKLLAAGRQYTQINVKTKKAAAQLKWEGAYILSADEIAASREKVKAEEIEFTEAFEKAVAETAELDAQE